MAPLWFILLLVSYCNSCFLQNEPVNTPSTRRVGNEHSNNNAIKEPDSVGVIGLERGFVPSPGPYGIGGEKYDYDQGADQIEIISNVPKKRIGILSADKNTKQPDLNINVPVPELYLLTLPQSNSIKTVQNKQADISPVQTSIKSKVNDVDSSNVVGIQGLLLAHIVTNVPKQVRLQPSNTQMYFGRNPKGEYIRIVDGMERDPGNPTESTSQNSQTMNAQSNIAFEIDDKAGMKFNGNADMLPFYDGNSQSKPEKGASGKLSNAAEDPNVFFQKISNKPSGSIADKEEMKLGKSSIMEEGELSPTTTKITGTNEFMEPMNMKMPGEVDFHFGPNIGKIKSEFNNLGQFNSGFKSGFDFTSNFGNGFTSGFEFLNKPFKNGLYNNIGDKIDFGLNTFGSDFGKPDHNNCACGFGKKLARN